MKSCISVLMAFALLLGCSTNDGKQAAADKIVQAIEQYRKQNGKLPASIAELGVKESEEGPAFYERKTDTRYVVWYGTTLGESRTYDSDLGHWEDHN